MKDNPKVFVTGGNGFLGSFLVDRLMQLGFAVVAPNRKECDLTYEGNLDKFNQKYDYIFHLAAHTQAGDWCLTHSGEQWMVNQKINTNVLSWWYRENKDSKFVTMGSSCSYDPSLPTVEENYMKGSPIESLYTYAMTKRMLFQGLRSLNSQFGMKSLYIVPSTLYGPGYHSDGRQMHFIFDIIRKILRAKEFGEVVELWGNGYQKRELIHVEDFVSNLIELVADSREGIFNIGSGDSHSIRDFVKLICAALNFDPDLIQYNEDRYTGARDKVLNVDKAVSAIRNYQDRDLAQGISEVINWFILTKSHH